MFTVAESSSLDAISKRLRDSFALSTISNTTKGAFTVIILLT